MSSIETAYCGPSVTTSVAKVRDTPYLTSSHVSSRAVLPREAVLQPPRPRGPVGVGLAGVGGEVGDEGPGLPAARAEDVRRQGPGEKGTGEGHLFAVVAALRIQVRELLVAGQHGQLTPANRAVCPRSASEAGSEEQAVASSKRATTPGHPRSGHHRHLTRDRLSRVRRIASAVPRCPDCRPVRDDVWINDGPAVPPHEGWHGRFPRRRWHHDVTQQPGRRGGDDEPW